MKFWWECKNWNVELDLSNYATKVDLTGASSIDTSTLASKTDLASLTTKVNNSDVGKNKAVSADLSKVSNDVVKKTVYDKLVIKVNAIDTKIPILVD